jgi:ATP-dependent exoDNAse (exonuclease V) alpha subunit
MNSLYNIRSMNDLMETAYSYYKTITSMDFYGNITLTRGDLEQIFEDWVQEADSLTFDEALQKETLANCQGLKENTQESDVKYRVIVDRQGEVHAAACLKDQEILHLTRNPKYISKSSEERIEKAIQSLLYCLWEERQRNITVRNIFTSQPFYEKLGFQPSQDSCCELSFSGDLTESYESTKNRMKKQGISYLHVENF